MKAPSNGTLKAVTIAAMLWAIDGFAFAQGADGPRQQAPRGMAATADWQDGPPPAFRGGPGMGGPGMGGDPEGRGPGGSGGPRGRQVGIVEIPAKTLAVMLGLSSDQTEKIAAIQKAGRPQRPPIGRMNGDDRGGPPMGRMNDDERGGPPMGRMNDDERGGPPNPGDRMAMGDSHRKKTKAAILAVLTESQKALVPQVTNEAMALHAARIPLPALQDLGLSSDQLKKIAAIGADGHKKATALLAGDSEDSDGPPQDSLRDTEEEMGDDVRALLTSDQRAKVRAARKQFRPGPEMGGPGGPGMEGPGKGGPGSRRGHGRPGFDSAENDFGGPPPPMNGGQGGPPRQARGPGGRQGFGGPPPPGFGGPGMDGPGGPGMDDGGPAGGPPGY